jgi:hypothetical protein
MLQFNDWKALNEKEKAKDTYDYGCSMVYFNSPGIIKIQEAINPDDLYTQEGDNTYGLEDEHHVTLLYGLHSDEVDEADVMAISADDIPGITLSNLSTFESKDYDVLKFDATCDKLHEINANLAKLPHTTSFPDYHPHATIAYLKPGCAEKYINEFKTYENIVEPQEIVYSKPDGSKIRQALKNL